MYNPGDHVFYPKGGVFVVQQEQDKVIGGRNIRFYDLISNDGKTKISIPISNIDRVGVRGLVTESELEDFINCWAPDLKISKLHHKNRKSRFEIMRQTGDFGDMGMVVVTIHHLIKKTKATFEEKRIYDQIRKRMIDEIQIVKGCPSSLADTLLQSALDEAIERKPIDDDEEALSEGEEGKTQDAKSAEETKTQGAKSTEEAKTQDAKGTEEAKTQDAKSVEASKEKTAS